MGAQVCKLVPSPAVEVSTSCDILSANVYTKQTPSPDDPCTTNQPPVRTSRTRTTRACPRMSMGTSKNTPARPELMHDIVDVCLSSV